MMHHARYLDNTGIAGQGCKQANRYNSGLHGSKGVDPTVTKQLEAIISTSLGDTAYEKIADAIVSGRFAPGEKLTIRGLAEMLGTSSTPVRDAVKRLILEHALEQRSLRDIRVPCIQPATYREIARIRIEMEGLAAAAAVETATPDQIDALERNIVRNEKAIAKADWPTATELNRVFHFELAQLAAMPVLTGILKSLWLQVGPPVAAYYRHGGTAMIAHHRDILTALRTGDPVGARKAIADDIRVAVEGIIEMLETAQNTATVRAAGSPAPAIREMSPQT